MANLGGWIEFDCPCCGIDYDIADIDGVPQWPTTDCFGRPISHVQAVEACQHYDAGCVPSGQEPPVGLYG